MHEDMWRLYTINKANIKSIPYNNAEITLQGIHIQGEEGSNMFSTKRIISTGVASRNRKLFGFYFKGDNDQVELHVLYFAKRRSAKKAALLMYQLFNEGSVLLSRFSCSPLFQNSPQASSKDFEEQGKIDKETEKQNEDEQETMDDTSKLLEDDASQLVEGSTEYVPMKPLKPKTPGSGSKRLREAAIKFFHFPPEEANNRRTGLHLHTRSHSLPNYMIMGTNVEPIEGSTEYVPMKPLKPKRGDYS